MCGRYISPGERSASEILMAMRQGRLSALTAAEIAEMVPGGSAPVFVKNHGLLEPMPARWGYSRPDGKAGVIHNARAETAARLPLFRDSLLRRRCIVPSFGFYEWTRDKRRYLYNLPEGPVLLMAGIFRLESGTLRFVILTTAANESVAPVHPRMPVVLPPEGAEAYLRGGEEAMTYLILPPPLLLCRET